MSVSLIGAGVAGLASAIALAESGHACCLFERKLAKNEAEGFGVQLAPNAVKALRRLGVWETFQPSVFFPSGVLLKDGKSGDTLAFFNRREENDRRYGAPYVTARRSDLVAALWQKVQTYSRVSVFEGVILGEGVADNEGGYKLSSPDRAYSCQAMIGADGVQSWVRAFFLREKASFSLPGGYCRALVPQSCLPAEVVDEGVTVWFLDGSHVVCYPVGGGGVNVVVTLSEGVETVAGVFSWELLLKRGACSALCQLFEAIPSSLWSFWPIKVCSLSSQFGNWGRGAAITFVGDSAHGMLPTLAQGAAMALEDACVLGEISGAFSQMSSEKWGSCFRVYERARHPRVKAVWDQSFRHGWAYRLGGALGLGRKYFLRMAPSDLLERRVSWIYRWSPGAE